MNTAVKTAKNIYRRFVEFEERAAAIYLHFASRFKQKSPLSLFWLNMAVEEKQHAGLLQFCLAEGLFAAELPDSAKTQRLLGFITRLEKQAHDPNLTIEEAFVLAIQLESSEINSIYCHLTTAIHSSMYLLRRKIAISLPNHVDELLTSARKFGVGNEAAKELDRLSKRCSAQWKPAKSASKA